MIKSEQRQIVDRDLTFGRLHRLSTMSFAVERLAVDLHRRGHGHSLRDLAPEPLKSREHLHLVHPAPGLRDLSSRIGSGRSRSKLDNDFIFLG